MKLPKDSVTADDYENRIIQKARFFFCTSSNKGIFDPPNVLRQAGFIVEVIENEDMVSNRLQEINQGGGTRAVVAIGSTNCNRSITLHREGAKLGISTFLVERTIFCSHTLSKSTMDWIDWALENESGRISRKPTDGLVLVSLNIDDYSGHKEFKISREIPGEIVIDIDSMVWFYNDETACNLYRFDKPIYLLGGLNQIDPNRDFLKAKPQTIAIFDSANLHHLENLATYCHNLGIPVKTDYEQ